MLFVAWISLTARATVSRTNPNSALTGRWISGFFRPQDCHESRVTFRHPRLRMRMAYLPASGKESVDEVANGRIKRFPGVDRRCKRAAATAGLCPNPTAAAGIRSAAASGSCGLAARTLALGRLPLRLGRRPLDRASSALWALHGRAVGMARRPLCLGAGALGVAQASWMTTGTWSEGCGLSRSALSGSAATNRSARVGDSKAWSIRNPMSRCQAPA